MKFNPAFRSLAFLPALIAVASFLALPEPAGGAPIYSQVFPENPAGAFPSNQSTTQKIASNFILDGPGPVSILSLRFIGGISELFPSQPPPMEVPLDNFRIVFLEDANGNPGLPIAGGDFGDVPVFKSTPTGGNLLNGFFEPLEYIIDLGDGITLNEGIPYWISITNDPGSDYGWAWARSIGTLPNSMLAATPGDVTVGPWTVGTSGMWFELNDENIPEPTSVAMLLTAFVPTSLIRKGILS